MRGLFVATVFVVTALCGVAADTILVPVGEPIQPALDKIAGTGGTVLLGAGVHCVTGTLQVASETTLAGRGPASVLLSDPTTRPQVIGTLVADLHDVTVRDMALVGPADPTQMVEPPADAETRRAMGIFMNSPTGAFRNIRLERLRVTLFEGMGVHLKGVSGLVIDGCDFDRTAAFNGLYHNVYLRRVKDVRVTNSLFRNNPVGNGLQVSWSEDVAITGNQSIDNAGHGIRVAETRKALIEGNEVLRNRGGAGIWLNTEKQIGCVDFTVRNNRVLGNLNRGIAIQNTRNSVFEGNVSLGNGVDFLFRNAFDVVLRHNRYKTTAEEKTNRVTFEDGGVISGEEAPKEEAR